MIYGRILQPVSAVRLGEYIDLDGCLPPYVFDSFVFLEEPSRIQPEVEPLKDARVFTLEDDDALFGLLEITAQSSFKVRRLFT